MTSVGLDEARERGLRYYFTGRPCKRGHVAKRFAGNKTCTECHRSQSAQWYSDNRDHSNEKHREWCERNRDKARSYSKKWRDSNPDKQAARARRDRINNPDRARARVAKWAAKNRDKLQALDAAYRARKRNAVGRYTTADVGRLLESQGAICVYCPVSLTQGYHVDHRLPLVRGGSNMPRNIQLLCAKCNVRKGKKTHREYVAFLGRDN